MCWVLPPWPWLSCVPRSLMSMFVQTQQQKKPKKNKKKKKQLRTETQIPTDSHSLTASRAKFFLFFLFLFFLFFFALLRSSFLLVLLRSSLFRDDTASETFLFGKLSAMPSWRHHKKRNTKPAVPTLHIQRQPLHLLSFLVSPSSFRIV